MNDNLENLESILNKNKLILKSKRLTNDSILYQLAHEKYFILYKTPYNKNL